MHKYKELKVWQKSIELVTDIYQVTAKFPDKERFGLVSQINSASVSIPSNIAINSTCFFVSDRNTINYIDLTTNI